MRKSLVETFGVVRKMQKGGVTATMIGGMMAMDWSESGGGRCVQVMKTAVMVAFSGMFRRSEYTGGSSTFNPNTMMTRGSAVWCHLDSDEAEDHAPITPWNQAAARALRDTGRGYCQLTPGVSKSDPEGDWQKYPVLLKLGSPQTAPVRAAEYLLDYEIAVPVFGDDRATTPLFVNPDRTSPQHPHGEWLTTREFDKAVIRALRAWYNHHHPDAQKTEKQIRDLYSLHSFRIGGLNALQAAGVPREIRMLLGRWKSGAVDGYTRQEVNMCLQYMTHINTDCELYTPLSDDLPQYPEAEEVAVGSTFELKVELAGSDQQPEDGTRPPRRISNPTLSELRDYFTAMEKRGRGRSSRRFALAHHPLMGRAVEIEFEVMKGEERTLQYFVGEIDGIDETTDKPVSVKFTDGETHSYSYEYILEALEEEEV